MVKTSEEILAANIRAWLEKKKIDQKALAGAVKLTEQGLSRILTLKRTARPTTVRRIAAYFGISEMELRGQLTPPSSIPEAQLKAIIEAAKVGVREELESLSDRDEERLYPIFEKWVGEHFIQKPSEENQELLSRIEKLAPAQRQELMAALAQIEKEDPDPQPHADRLREHLSQPKDKLKKKKD